MKIYILLHGLTKWWKRWEECTCNCDSFVTETCLYWGLAGLILLTTWRNYIASDKDRIRGVHEGKITTKIKFACSWLLPFWWGALCPVLWFIWCTVKTEGWERAWGGDPHQADQTPESSNFTRILETPAALLNTAPRAAYQNTPEWKSSGSSRHIGTKRHAQIMHQLLSELIIPRCVALYQKEATERLSCNNEYYITRDNTVTPSSSVSVPHLVNVIKSPSHINHGLVAISYCV